MITGLVSLALIEAGEPAVLADTAPPANTITHVGELANFRANAGPGADYHTVLFSDVRNRRFFAENEYPGQTGDSCGSRLVAYNFDTLSKLASGCLPTSVNMIGGRPGAGGGSYNVLGAADSVDHLLFFTGHQVTDTQPTMQIVDENTLKVLGNWALPAGVPPTKTVAGLSWSSNGDTLLVLSDNLDLVSGAPVVALSSVDIHASMAAGGSTPVVRWQLLISQCSLGLRTAFGTADAYLTEDGSAAIVPCQLAGNVNTLSEGSQTVHQGSYGIVRVEVGKCSATSATVQCPSETTVAPSPISDVIYDAVSGRAVVTYVTASSFSLDVYDGGNVQKLPAFIGGLNASGGLSSSLAFDDQTGRLYAATTTALTAIDIRRTPFAPGTVETQIHGPTFSKVLPVLSAGGAHAYPRLLVDYKHDQALPSFGIYSDTIPVTADPPANDVDLNTKTGIAPGTPLVVTYSGAASGFGVHADYVGGPGAVVYNNADGPDTGASADTVRFIGGTRDLVAGWVQESHLSHGVSSASATALGDANDSTASDYAACSNTSNAGECQPQAAGISVPSAAATTSQRWPYPDARCDQPGADAERSAWDGAYWNSQTPDAAPSGSPQPGSTPQPLPAADAGPARIGGASTSVDCAAAPPADGVTVKGSVATSAEIAGVNTQSGGSPSLSIMGASAQTVVQPPTQNSGATSTATADARSIRIDLPGHTLSIGEVYQQAIATAAGVKGSAIGTDSIRISDITLDGMELCQVCTPDNIAQVNSALPTLINLSEPSPDLIFGPMSGDTVPGSPGGYEAVVQANVLEQQGDGQFNVMSPAEAVIHPALRVVLYDNSSGETNRKVIDLAGAEADAEQGIDSLEQPAPPPPTPPNVILEQQAAGYVTNTITVPGPAVTHNIPATDGAPNGIVGVVEQAMTGLQYLVRSPIQALKMFLVLSVLGLPLFLMIRRRTWLAER